MRSQRIALEAETIGKRFFPALMHSALSVPSVGLTEAYQEFLAQLLEDAGHPTDPIERMMLEQLAFVHFRIAHLHVLATESGSVESQRLLTGCAARLQGEFRKTALARQSLRSSQPKTRRESGRLKIASAA